MNNKNLVYDTINVASGRAYSVIEIYDIVAKILKTDVKPIFRDAKLFWEKYPDLYAGDLKLDKNILENEVNKYALGDNAKAKELGWSPIVNMDSGLKRCIEYAKKIFGE